MKNDQREYIAYVKAFAETNRDHIWLGGSFLRGNPTPFSDVDISAYMGVDSLREYLVQNLQLSRSSAKDIFHKYMTILSGFNRNRFSPNAFRLNLLYIDYKENKSRLMFSNIECYRKSLLPG